MDPNQFDDRLARLAELSDEELAALETEILAAFDAADSAGDIAQMQALADSLDQLRAEKDNRGSGASAEAPAEAPAAPAAPPAAPAVAASAKTDEDDKKTSTAVTVETDGPDVSIKTTGPDGTSVTVENAGDAADGAAASDAPAADPVDPVDNPEDVPVDPDAPANPEAEDATAPVVDLYADPTNPDEEEAVKVTNADVPEGNQPVAASSAPTYAITAGGDIPTITAGSPLADMDAVIDAMTKKVNSMRGVSGGGEQVIVASLRRDLAESFGEERTLKKGDIEGNSAKVRDYLKVADSMESLVATGWCAPKTPLYDVPGIGTTDTPVADSMASFGVDRGGIIWTEPPTMPNVADGLKNLGFWMNVNAGDPDTGDPLWMFVPGIPGVDNLPGQELKPCFEIECGFEHQAELQAIPLCMCFDNLTTRTYPEYVKATTDLVMIGQARFKEQWLLAQMFGAKGVQSNHGGQDIGNPDSPLGVVRDFLIVLRLAVAQFKWRNRLSNSQQLRLYAPAWLRDAMASDLMVQIPGDDTLSTSDSELNGYISECGVSDPVWYIDDMPIIPAAVSPTTDESNFDSYHGYPAKAEWLLTLPGVFTRLDGGSLDLGVVRTKEDVQKNKYCEFAETFEAVAYMGPTDPDHAWAIRGTTNVTVRGGFTPAVAVDPKGVIFE